MKMKWITLCALLIALPLQAALRSTGDMGVIVERATGQLLIVEHSNNTVIKEVDGLGDLSHASVVYSRDQRYAFVFGRDGGLTKVDLLNGEIAKRIMQSGNSIGGAISQDGSMVAVSNYKPGGVRIFDVDTLEMIADIPAEYDNGKLSKTVGLVDAPGNRFVFSLYDANEIWVIDMNNRDKPEITKFKNVGSMPYDGLISPDGRYYIAGLFGEDSLALLDMWHTDKGMTKILSGYAVHDEKLPVYKMPHLEGFAMAGNQAFMPAVGQHKVLVVDTNDWAQKKSIDVHGQPIFVMARPDGRQVWVNFAHPRNDTIQVIDVETHKIIKTLKPGKAVLHMEFTPRGENIWMSVRDDNRIVIVDTQTFSVIKTLDAKKPSGIFFTNRAHKIGL
jgi:protein NirF